MNLKPRFEEYTETEFTQLVSEICIAEGNEAYQDELLDNFIAVTEHPEGSDLIFYNEDNGLTPEKIVATVRSWRMSEGLADLKT
ncbi:bacteriocin immunity protein [Candidatus Pantoea floridensis]|uniref:Colicin immunity protein / pyocin immunity protein n=1 Tax=Candidatus Pantoea floridensis TaxID=1938870 RepID=A0A286DR06_9GAMM|nr:bacteriocin immunity protein [Pantoea floridensis]PIF07580.1 colicin immunity protein/pyocin immunity protein [Enterobacteriaceae bacterium JKS000233]SOD61112.1 Colicin immunity protein / pyocin immunity protein [Pantoea floridensis]